MAPCGCGEVTVPCRCGPCKLLKCCGARGHFRIVVLRKLTNEQLRFWQRDYERNRNVPDQLRMIRDELASRGLAIPADSDAAQLAMF
ncbi:unnamed protein product [marine sediment metagenome]|uniref:Uncharacterized protein n=1 Tax=marine sediment metagenome TaxID=412755 RepID=X0YAW4_9ZZZZ